MADATEDEREGHAHPGNQQQKSSRIGDEARNEKQNRRDQKAQPFEQLGRGFPAHPKPSKDGKALDSQQRQADEGRDDDQADRRPQTDLSADPDESGDFDDRHGNEGRKDQKSHACDFPQSAYIAMKRCTLRPEETPQADATRRGRIPPSQGRVHPNGEAPVHVAEACGKLDHE